MDYSIKGFTRHCAISGRKIEPGEGYYSAVLRDDDDQLQRQDFATESWSEPPAGCVGWWQAELPAQDDNRVYWAPNEVLLAYFENLIENDDQPQLIYVMAILLVRRRLMAMGETRIDEQGQSWMEVRRGSAKKSDAVEVLAPTLSEQQIVEIQNKLGEHLFTNQPTASPAVEAEEAAEQQAEPGEAGD